MNYQETLQFLYSQLPAYHRIGKAAYKGDLNTSTALDNHFGNPHRNFAAIHVAGTNGKGSVSHMIASVLQESGYRTGLYTSPHLKDFRERIRINGQMIGEDKVVEFVSVNRDILRKLEPSFFEMTVAMAFDHFARSGVDIAVVEVGLGGRLDSTNIITPVLSVITNIGSDHQDLLGNTPERIAWEKAGIIKEKVPVVISETQPAVRDVFVSRAEASGSLISFADQRFKCTLGEVDLTRGERHYKVRDFETGKESEGSVFLCGDYQEHNICAVFSAFENMKSIFREQEFKLTEGIGKVVANTGLAGRWQILGTSPLIICDTAHNRDGLEFVIRQLGRIERKRLHIVIGFVNDKDIDSILPLFPADAAYYFTRASVPRALDEKILLEKAAASGLSGNSFSTVRSALDEAKNNAGDSDLIFIGGSTFVVAEVV